MNSGPRIGSSSHSKHTSQGAVAGSSGYGCVEWDHSPALSGQYLGRSDCLSFCPRSPKQSASSRSAQSLVPKQIPGIYHPQNPRTGGFSFIELLIVTALIVIMFTVLYSDSSRSYQSSQMGKCENNLQNIYVALQTFSIANTDRFPVMVEAKTAEEPLSELIPKYTIGASLFICPGCQDRKLPDSKPFARRKISYAYYMGHKPSDGADQPLMSDRQVDTNSKQAGQLLFSLDGKKPGNNHNKYGGNILFCDGSIKSSPAVSTFVLTNGPGIVLLNPRP